MESHLGASRATCRGFTLIEVVVTMGLFVLLILSSVTGLLDWTKTARETFVRDQFLSSLQKYSGMAGVIRNSARQSENSALANCLTIGSPGELDCESGKVYPVRLYGPFQGALGSGGDGPVTGTESAPMFYTREGGVCLAGNTSCAFEVSATFRPVCPYALPSLQPIAVCDQAVVIEVSYLIKSLPPSSKVYRGSVATPVKQVFGL